MEVRLTDRWRVLRYNLISMSHVCKSWREAVISYPFLWDSIHDESEMVTRMCLERSKPLPLAVSLSNFDSLSSNTKRMVNSHAGRFEKLSLSGSFSYGLPEIFTSLMLGEDPLLRELILRSDRGINSKSWVVRMVLDSPIIPNDIPTLHKIVLSSFPLTPQLSTLRHLTDVCLADPGPTANAVLDLLANNPCLQQVAISGPLENQNSPRGDQSITLPHLRNLDVTQCAATDILRCLHLPRSEPLVIEIDASFNEAPLPRAYRPYSVIQLAWDFGFRELRVVTSPKFRIHISFDSSGWVTAELGELPPKSVEVLGLSTVQFITHFHFREGPERLDMHPLELSDPFGYMDGLETLVLGCLSASLNRILLILNLNTVCPLLHTLIVLLPEDEPAGEWCDVLLGVVRSRADDGKAIRRLRIVVWSEECIPAYSNAFDSFVQEVEVLNEVGDGGSWMVWED